MQILHVYSEPNHETSEFEALFAELQVQTRPARDCYAAMAELARRRTDDYVAVLVSLAGLVRSDREFFQLASRRFHLVPTYVYGPETADINAPWAVQAGARCHVAPRHVPSLVQTWAQAQVPAPRAPEKPDLGPVHTPGADALPEEGSPHAPGEEPKQLHRNGQVDEVPNPEIPILRFPS